MLRQPSANIRSVNLKTWLIFAGVQTAGVVAMHLGHDWSLILGVLLLVPGIPALYMFSGIHRLIMIADFWLAVAGILINAKKNNAQLDATSISPFTSMSQHGSAHGSW